MKPNNQTTPEASASMGDLDQHIRRHFRFQVDDDHPAGTYKVEVNQDGSWVHYDSFTLKDN